MGIKVYMDFNLYLLREQTQQRHTQRSMHIVHM